MLKRVTKLLLIFTLGLQILLPAMNVVSANEGNMPINIMVDELEDDQEPIDLDVEASNDNEEDEVLNENIESDVETSEPEPESEYNETYDVETSESESEYDETEDIEISESEYDEIGDIEIQTEEELAIPQASIDEMRAFLESNSPDNPFIIPAGSSFAEAINARDWGENIIVFAPMSGMDAPEGTIWGSIFLVLNSDMDLNIFGDADYGFFDIGIFVQFEDDEDQISRPLIPQDSIDAMRTFLESNSPDNPFIIPTGLTFNEAINARDWGENVSVFTPMSGMEMETLPGTIFGAMALGLDLEIDSEGNWLIDDADDLYWFVDVVLYFVNYEDLTNEDLTEDLTEDTEDTNSPANEPSERPGNRLRLPQTGREAMNATLIGVGVLAVCGGVIYLKRRKK